MLAVMSPVTASASTLPPVVTSLPARRVDVRGTYVLVVDDSPGNLRFASYMLRRLGCVVATANDGDGVVGATATAVASGTPFDVVVMACSWPACTAMRRSRDSAPRGTPRCPSCSARRTQRARTRSETAHSGSRARSGSRFPGRRWPLRSLPRCGASSACVVCDSAYVWARGAWVYFCCVYVCTCMYRYQTLFW